MKRGRPRKKIIEDNPDFQNSELIPDTKPVRRKLIKHSSCNRL
jgi:hypothetical protein